MGVISFYLSTLPALSSAAPMTMCFFATSPQLQLVLIYHLCLLTDPSCLSIP